MMGIETKKAKRSSITVEAPEELRFRLREIAFRKRVVFKDFILDILEREANRSHDPSEVAHSQA